MSSATQPYDFHHVPKYPETLQVYRIPASKFWQVRMFVDRKYIRKTTKCIELSEALEFAKNFYDQIRIDQRLDINVHSDTFHACANLLMKKQESLVNRGDRNQRILAEDAKKLKKDILPFFETKSVQSIDAQLLEDYIEELTSKRKLSPSTLSKHLVVIRKVLNEALRRGYIASLPLFPKISRQDNPRPYFSYEEYGHLKKKARELAEQNIKVRGVPLTSEMYEFIKFHVNVFVRPSDIKLLKHKHVSVERIGDNRFLSIYPPNSKTVVRESVSLEGAVRMYQRLLDRNKKRGLGGKENYVFFAQYQNREYALQTMRRQFEYILQEADLKSGRSGQKRTIYSLRHTALMLRLLNAENIDIFMLARNALTSVDQLERFYLSHVESRMKIKNLQSYSDERKPGAKF